MVDTTFNDATLTGDSQYPPCIEMLSLNDDVKIDFYSKSPPTTVIVEGESSSVSQVFEQRK